MTPVSKLKLAALYTHPIQYFAPLSRALARRAELDFTCFFCDASAAERSYSDFGVPEVWGVGLTDGYRAEFLRNMGGRGGYGHLSSFVNPGILPALWRGRFDALLLHGYKSATHLLAVAAAHALGTRVFVRCDAAGDGRSSAARRALLRSFDGALFVGTKNRQFFLDHGVADDRLYFAPYSVDNDLHRRQARDAAPLRTELRASWSVPDDACCVLFVGRLAPEKNVDLLVRALATASDAPLHLLLVGDGPLREELARAAAARGLSKRLTFTGFLDQVALAKAFVAADVFALPSSREPWGLVLNEAMNYSLPVLASDRVGAAVDLVTPSNGRMLPSDDVAAWADTLSWMAREKERRIEMGRASLRHIDGWSVERTIDGIVRAVLTR